MNKEKFTNWNNSRGKLSTLIDILCGTQQQQGKKFVVSQFKEYDVS